MLTVNPGETMRRRMTFYTAGRDSPPLDLTDVVFSVRNLSPAPWTIEILPVDLPNGQVQLKIDATETQAAEEYSQYPFQIRLQHPDSDVQYLPAIVINTGPAYLAADPVEPVITPVVEIPGEGRPRLAKSYEFPAEDDLHYTRPNDTSFAPHPPRRQPRTVNQ